MDNGLRKYGDISLFYYINRELFIEEKEQLLLLEKEAAIRVVKTEFSFWRSGMDRRFSKEDNGESGRNICISDHCDVLRYAKNAGWTVIAYRDSILEEQERRGEDTYFVSYAVEDLSVIDREYLETVYCRCNDISRLIAETERLFIREIALGDLDELMEVFESNNKTDFFEPFYNSREDAEEFLIAYIRNVYRFYDYGIWGIYLKTSGRMIGIVGFTPREGTGEKTVLELGYGISKKYQNCGYAGEVCRAVVEYAEDKLEYEKIIKVTKDGVKVVEDSVNESYNEK